MLIPFTNIQGVAAVFTSDLTFMAPTMVVVSAEL